MPFELGMAYFNSRISDHRCFVFDSSYKNFDRSLSDLKGIDILQHDSDESQIFSRLTEAFNTEFPMPTVRDMMIVYLLVKGDLRQILEDAGSPTIFHARAFEEVVLTAGLYWKRRQVKSRSNQP